jgi:hypothetical protein
VAFIVSEDCVRLHVCGSLGSTDQYQCERINTTLLGAFTPSSFPSAVQKDDVVHVLHLRLKVRLGLEA